MGPDFFRDHAHYEPLPLPDRVMRPDAEALAAAEAFRDYMRKRHMVRDFLPDPVPEAVIAACIEAAGTAPSGANHQPWHFVAIADPAMKAGDNPGGGTPGRNGHGSGGCQAEKAAGKYLDLTHWLITG